ncbi:MAG: hypothetical protein ACHQCF_04480 [Solirubrobacterales bacterium]
MHWDPAFTTPIASLKVLLLPLAILGFLLFLMLIGAIGLGLAMSLISAITWLVRLPGRRFARRSRLRRQTR